MKRSEIIHMLREPVQSVMESFNKDEIDIHFPSKVIAYCIYLYENGKITDTDITDKNNPIGFLNPSSNSIHEYNSLVECLYDFALDSSTDEEFTDQVYKSIVKANNLNRFDKEELYKREGSIIDVPDTEPSVDFEPEYITISNDSLTAYVTLQEANSIATIDLTTKQVTRVDSLGFKDYSSGDNKVDLYKKDDAIINIPLYSIGNIEKLI